MLGGLTRVRAIQLNDAHIFCTLDQVAGEAAGGAGADPPGVRATWASARPGTGCRCPARAGSTWPRPRCGSAPTALLTEVLDALRPAPTRPAEGEAAFYGPKIDVQVADSAGRESTLSTVQVDFHQPEQFGLHYIGAGRRPKHRPVMVHRSIVGSVERAVAHLIERHGGAFPAWLAPAQLVDPAGHRRRAARGRGAARSSALDQGLRAELPHRSSGSLGARIREARLVPYQAVIGAKEAAAGQVALRLRDGRRLEPRPASEVLARIGGRIKAHTPDLWDAGDRID